MEKEHWRRIPGLEGRYAVSSFGRVVSFRHKKLIRIFNARKRNKIFWPSDRYLVVDLTVNRVRKRYAIHKLVLTAFRGPRRSNQECRHLDGDPTNNRLSNLRWGTRKQNHDDWRQNGKNLKVGIEKVHYIRGSTKTGRALAAELGLSETSISLIKNHQTWADV